jgi:hypothetical protein
LIVAVLPLAAAITGAWYRYVYIAAALVPIRMLAVPRARILSQRPVPQQRVRDPFSETGNHHDGCRSPFGGLQAGINLATSTC